MSSTLSQTRVMERAIPLDPRSPFVLDTRELGRRPGAMRSVRLTVAAVESIGTTVIGIPTGAAVELDLRLEAVLEGVLVSGHVRGRATGECVRCLDPVGVDVDATVQELYLYPERAALADAPADGEEEAHELDGDLLDIEQPLRDAVVLMLPFQPVCGPDCPGLCAHCGARLADDPGHGHDIIDPRWAELRRLQDLMDEKRES